MDTRRDFIFVDDLIDVVMQAVDGTGRAASTTSPRARDFSIKELFDATVAALGIQLDDEVEVRPRGADDAFTILLDPSRTQTGLRGWRATRRSRTASPRRSTTTASTASSRPSRTCKVDGRRG